jgi:uncharacterized protein involved in exopolysaccharide biosynthesis
MYGHTPETFRIERDKLDSASAAQPSWKPSTAQELLDVVYRYRWLILATFFTTVLSTALWLFVRYDSYETTTKILVRFARDSFNPRAEVSSSVTRMLPAPRPDLATETDLIGSYAIISEVVDRLHLDRPGPPESPPQRIVPRLRFELRRFTDWVTELGDELQYAMAVKERLSPREKAIVEVSEALSAEKATDSSVLSIKLRTKFKEGASVILNTLVDVYSEQRTNVERNPGKVEFFDKQVDGQRTKLLEQERSLEDLKRKAGIYGALPEQLDVANRRVMEFENQERTTAALLASLEAKAQTLSAQLRQQQPTLVVSEVDQRNALLDTLNERRSALVLERQKLLGKFADGHASIRDIDGQIAEADRLIASTRESVRQSQTTSLNQNFADLQKDLLDTRQSIDAAKAQLAEQRSTLARLEEERDRLQGADSEYRRLTRAIAIDEEAYKFQRRNSDELKAAEAMTVDGVTQIAVVDKAVDPIVPKGFRKIYILGGSVAAGLLLAFGLAFVCNGLDGSVTHPAALAQELERPPLAVLPYSKNIRKALPPDSMYERSAGAIASELDSLHRNSGFTAFSFVAPNPSAGVTTVASTVAKSLAKTPNRSVLLLRVSSTDGMDLSRVVAAPPQKDGTAAEVEGAFAPSLTASEVSEQVHAFVRRTGYDLTVIDVPADLAPHQQMGAAAGSQSVVLVVEAQKTPRTAVRAWTSRLRESGIRLAGAVLNKHQAGWGQQAG